MCTAATYTAKDHYFGRNLDLEFSYNETVTVTPRNYPFQFRKVKALESHYAMIGMAFVVDNYPLYYDATNEKGLSMAGLNFPENADYKQETEGKDNVTPFEFIPWILGQCSTIEEVKELLGRINLININFSEKLPLSPLHWMISDRNESITVESVKEGLKIYDNPVGILTNNPTFDIQMFNLNNYVNVTREGIGIPGDLSSSSRFVKAVFTKLNSVSGTSESESISQFFHILGSVNQERGCVRLAEDTYEITIYSSCCNIDKGVYYYKTYENSQITGVDMHNENLNSQNLVSYPLIKEQQIKIQN